MEGHAAENGASTPPRLAGEKRAHSNGADRPERVRNGSDAIDPVALDIALKEFEAAGKPRQHTPSASPSRKRQRVYGDR
jgi:cell division cycle 20-like protein 1 (cofactor of APC complex)